MNRIISSRLTFFYKFIFPALWITGFGIGTIAIPSKTPEKTILLIVWISGTLYLWTCFTLKQIQIDGTDLVISNFFKIIRIPLNQICDVTENIFINIHPVWIHFRNTTKFGSKIKFMPKVTFKIFCSHPIVSELKELSRR
jgi:hypothetical protein